MNNSFRVNILASGSRGNAVLVEAGNTSLLIDAGISARRIISGLALCGLKPEKLAGIFITHEHCDHVNGLPLLAKKSRVEVFAREKTWLALNCRSQVDASLRRLLPMEGLTVGEMEIRPFSLSHDAAEPVGFNIFYKGKKCSLATDLGFVDSGVKEAMSGSDVIILEANHDIKMLAEGSYHPKLKARIRSKQGHLSNHDAGRLLSEISGKSSEIFLVHLSKENNRPETAKKTIEDILESRGLAGRSSIYVAEQDSLVGNCGREG